MNNVADWFLNNIRYHATKDFYIIWHSTLLDMSVPDEGYSSNVPDEGYSRKETCLVN